MKWHLSCHNNGVIASVNNAGRHLPAAPSQTGNPQSLATSGSTAFQETMLAAESANKTASEPQAGTQTGVRRTRPADTGDCNGKSAKKPASSELGRGVQATAAIQEPQLAANQSRDSQDTRGLDACQKISSCTSQGSAGNPVQAPEEWSSAEASTELCRSSTLSPETSQSVSSEAGMLDAPGSPEPTNATDVPGDMAGERSSLDAGTLPAQLQAAGSQEGTAIAQAYPELLTQEKDSSIPTNRNSNEPDGIQNADGPAGSNVEPAEGDPTEIALQQGIGFRDLFRGDQTRGEASMHPIRLLSTKIGSKGAAGKLQDADKSLRGSESKSQVKSERAHEPGDAEQSKSPSDFQNVIDPNKSGLPADVTLTSRDSVSGGGTGITSAVSVSAHSQSSQDLPSSHSNAFISDSGESMDMDQLSRAASNAGTIAQPVVNSAQLIQSLGKSEIKIGMQSEEFGKISITTSHTRDALVAQIYVDHGDLAKSLADHLPDVQSRLASSHSGDVRIAMASGSSGTAADSSAGQSNQQPNQERQDNKNFERGTYDSGYSQPASPMTSEPATSMGMATAGPIIPSRLDLRA